MKAALFALIGAVVSVLAFPPFGPGWLIVAGVTLFLAALRLVESGRAGFVVGALYGLVFFGGLMWWLAELELIALVLVPLQALFLAVYGRWLVRFNKSTPPAWLALAVGGWGVMELIRYHAPVGGLEWGAAGYALSDNLYLRLPAAGVGTSGLTIVVVTLSALLALALTRSWSAGLRWAALVPMVAIAATVPSVITLLDTGDRRVAIVQGSTPCPFEHCAPNERLGTYEQHLALTGTIPAGTADLVVWPEGSTGSINADPVLVPAIGEAIAAEASRIGAPTVVGGDRVVSDTEWVNANVYFDQTGDIVGEYRKQHPVPFGEYIPLRRLFEWIPALDRVPRDMIRGDGPVVFDGGVGSIISFEGGFSRYGLETRRAGATVLIVNTNEASYGPDAPTSDQFIGMTRMRAVELGVAVIHAAVTGKSTVIDHQGSFETVTGLGTGEVLFGTFGASTSTIYTTTGDLLMYVAAIVAIIVWSRALVGSDDRRNQED